jgi:hypothetical protein
MNLMLKERIRKSKEEENCVACKVSSLQIDNKTVNNITVILISRLTHDFFKIS